MKFPHIPQQIGSGKQNDYNLADKNYILDFILDKYN